MSLFIIFDSSTQCTQRCSSEDQQKLIKSLAIILIVNKEDELPGNDLCLKKCAVYDEYEQAVSELVKAQFIYKRFNRSICV